MALHQRSQILPVPGRLAYHCTTEGQLHTQIMVELTQSLGWIESQKSNPLRCFHPWAMHTT